MKNWDSEEIRLSDEAQEFLRGLQSHLQKHKIELFHWDIDHICYRTASAQDYEATKKKFSMWGQLLIETPVNGRLIATYQLKNPIPFQGRSIDCVEVPAPKPSRETLQGFEHIEIVAEKSLNRLLEEFKNQSLSEFLVTSGMKKNLNPELELNFGTCAIKFHTQSLKSVVRIEKNARVSDFLSSSGFFEFFKDDQPLISGSFPLGLELPSSDLDLLCEASDLGAFETRLNSWFSSLNSQHAKDFSCKRAFYQGIETSLARWMWKDLPVELFVQKPEVLEFRSHRHFLVEDRLLKLGGKKIAEQIRKLKKLGLKTEPAFAEAFKIEGDSYLELERLSWLPESELRSLLNIQSD